MFVGLFYQFRRYKQGQGGSAIHARSSMLWHRGRRECKGEDSIRVLSGEEFVGGLLERCCETEDQVRARVEGYISLARRLGFVLKD